MKNIKTISKLQRLPLQDVWENKTQDFIPWLQANLDILSEALGFTLNHSEKEQTVKQLNVDLVMEDDNNQTVVIEAQLEPSDPTHLGELLTSLTAIEAKTAVWIVSEPRPEHIKTIAWLNTVTPATFYLLKVEAVQIGTSPAAALFTLVLDPKETGTAVDQYRQALSPKKWDEMTFFAELESNQETLVVEVARQIFDWAQANASYVSWGEGHSPGYFIPVFYYAGKKHQLFAVKTEGTVEIYFQWYQYTPPFNAVEKRMELLQRLNEIERVAIPEEAIVGKPVITLKLLQSQQALEHFLETFNWFIREL